MAFLHTESNSQPFKSAHAIGHQGLAARLVDRGLRAVSDCHLKALLPRGNRRCQARGAAADYENICRIQNRQSSPLQQYKF
jgi:hypothetical protein